MAATKSTEDHLLPSHTAKAISFLKPFLILFSLAAIISLVTFAPFNLKVQLPLYHAPLSNLCVHSPDPAACTAVLSDSISANRHPNSFLRSLLGRSLLEIHTALYQSTNLQSQINDPNLRDCIDLLDLSRDRILSSAAALATGSYADARTWLSAVLTNHVTCRDSLDKLAHLQLIAKLDSLTAQASVALAVLRAVSADDGNLMETIKELPSWVGPSERKLLEATSVNAVPVDVTVAQNGGGNYKTVQAAVDAAPDNGNKRFVIYVKQGTYKENVSVGKKKMNLMIIGDGKDATIITGSLNVADGSTTFNSATLAAVGDGFMLQDLCIENTAGAAKGQAVALRIGADRSVVNRCQIRAYQDTLYAHSLRQFYRDSVISGTVDFIFGDAAVVLQNCELQARKPMSGQKNAVTAQGRVDPNQNTGTSIQNCKVVPSVDLAPVKTSFPTYLGRPWKQYSRTVVMQSNIGDLVNPKGWLEWDGDFALKTLYYGEYQNSGPGAGTAGRVNWPGYHVITDPKEAQKFTVGSLIQGGQWLGSTGVAFTEGL